MHWNVGMYAAAGLIGMDGVDFGRVGIVPSIFSFSFLFSCFSFSLSCVCSRRGFSFGQGLSDDCVSLFYWRPFPSTICCCFARCGLY
ncbi:hypothetical protein BDV29DRAFT_173463 [Aspergillus leporis]|jgi:hypothetical protein|uniref:Uncharacterized protein n=1 Tax=Aspergillus leporis TaxID=41062 RepID=A0A5N5X1Q8_9EURO|nr:hypothetical protein BDV29DRAFT_173463 [Aspergillus leporis]